MKKKNMKKSVCFYLNTNTPEIIERVEFYKIDIQILKDLGFDVHFCFSYKKIPSNVDFYFIWWWTYSIFPVIKAKILGKKTVITGTFDLAHHSPGADYYSRPFYQRVLLKYSARLASANIFVSKLEYEKSKQEISRHNVFYSPHVLNVEKYVIKQKKERQKYLFTIAWMNKTNARRKCIPQIIETIAELKKRGKKVLLYIAGKLEDDAHDLIDLVKNLKLKEDVIFLGSIDENDKIKRLHECGIYIQPTLYEGFGLAIAEAGLCAAPIITSPAGAVPEVTNGHCTYAECNPRDIADAVEMIFNDYESSLLKAEKAQKFIEENFNYSRRKEDIKQILIKEGIL